jgi:hypothetical protein
MGFTHRNQQPFNVNAAALSLRVRMGALARRPVVGVSFVLGVSLVAGCNVGKGSGSLAGTLYLQSCTDQHGYGTQFQPAPFNLKPDFFVADPVDDFQRQFPMNRLSIRIQPNGARVEEADVFYVNMASEFPVAQQLGKPIQVGIGGLVRASLVLNATCPDASVEAELDGMITFTSFGSANQMVAEDFRIKFGDHLAGSIAGTIVDRRFIALGGVGGVPDNPAAGGQLAGTFDFDVRQGQAAQSYP